MNEVRPTPAPVTAIKPAAASAASSKGVDGAVPLPPSGNELPVKETKKPDDAAQVAVKIEQAVTEINEYVQSIQRDLHFSVDEESGLTIIRVRDKESGELIRQIPEDIFLNLAQKLKDNQTLHLFDAHG